MPEPSWAEGYVVDVGYTHNYFRALAPTGLRFTALLGAVQPLDTDPAFAYYELGCGNGRSSLLHAACNPQGSFYGIDFNPLHVHSARKLAQEAGVGNVQFLEKSFAELLDTDLPEADFVALHGVYSWVSDDNRRHIVEFIRRRLKPGGLVFVSYNCLPGLAQVAPLQRLLSAHAASGGGALPERVRRALEFARRLEASGAEYFRANPLAAQRLQGMGAQDPSYVAHEYFNANWSPSYHADVAQEMAAAKLSYVASASVMDNFEQFVLRPEMAAAIAELGDPAMAETVKDFARNRVFRRDVYARGAPRADPRELQAMLGATRFALARPRALCALSANTPVGEVNLQQERYAPVLDALARAPTTFGTLAGALARAPADRERLRQTVFALAALDYVSAAMPAEGEAARRASTGRYNAAIIAQAPRRAASAMLASPVLGCGVPASFIDLLLLAAPRSIDEAIAHACGSIAASGQTPFKDGKPVTDALELRTVVEARARPFFSDLLPFLRSVGVAD
jgi:SAM-dependent methyltransferase